MLVEPGTEKENLPCHKLLHFLERTIFAQKGF
jgi:hypothetical protein